ncbi:iron donor protein CyaY, partial [Pseudoalteromonas sp. S1941]
QWIDNRSGAEFWQFMSDAATKQANIAIEWQHD